MKYMRKWANIECQECGNYSLVPKPGDYVMLGAPEHREVFDNRPRFVICKTCLEKAQKLFAGPAPTVRVVKLRVGLTEDRGWAARSEEPEIQVDGAETREMALYAVKGSVLHTLGSRYRVADMIRFEVEEEEKKDGEG